MPRRCPSHCAHGQGDAGGNATGRLPTALPSPSREHFASTSGARSSTGSCWWTRDRSRLSVLAAAGTGKRQSWKERVRLRWRRRWITSLDAEEGKKVVLLLSGGNGRCDADLENHRPGSCRRRAIVPPQGADQRPPQARTRRDRRPSGHQRCEHQGKCRMTGTSARRTWARVLIEFILETRRFQNIFSRSEQCSVRRASTLRLNERSSHPA